jgi:outer membrane protein TolC/anti-anti-sigma regulatory factor
MEAREFKLDGLIVLELQGRVDEFNTSVLGSELRTIINTGRFRIVVDLGKVGFLSADCLREIWRCQRIARIRGGDIVLIVGAVEQVQETIGYVRFDKVVRCFSSLAFAAEYLHSLSGAPIPVDLPRAREIFHQILPWISREGIQRIMRILLVFLATFLSVQLKSFASVASQDTYTLEEAINLAREASPAIRLARLKMMEREAEVRVARSVGLPKIIGTGGYLYQSNPNVLGDIVNRELNNVRNPSDDMSVSQLQTRTRFNISKDAAILGMGFSQIVYSGGMFDNQLALREAQKREADALVSIESLAVEDQVRNLYLGVLLAREKMKYLSVYKSALEQRRKAASKAFSMRTMSAVQFSEIDLLLLRAQQDELLAKKDEQNVRGLLNILLGRSIDANFGPRPVAVNMDFKIESPEHYFEIGIHRYPELRRNSALMDSSASFLKVVEAQSTFSPQVMVFGSLEQTYGLGTLSQDTSWTLGFGVYVPLYDGRKSNAELEKASSLASQARLSYQVSERKLQVDINEAVSEVQRSRIQVQLAEKAVEIAARKKVEAGAAVKQGQLPLYRLSEVLAQEIEARMMVIGAQSEFFKWRSKLLMLTGQREF